MRPYLVNKKVMRKMYKKKLNIKKINKNLEFSSKFNFMIVILIIFGAGLMYYRYLEKKNRSDM